MSDVACKSGLSESDKSKLFWASFLALAAAGVGFVFRSMVPDLWQTNFKVSSADVGSLFGAGLWPIAITMIVFSLLVDKIGYKISMYTAFAFQAASVVLTITAGTFDAMWWACICAGLGHGIVEAVINPLCASMYREDKSKMLNILHASWPAGIVAGAIVWLTIFNKDGATWANSSVVFWFMLLPIIAYAIMFALCKNFPVDERVEANVSMKDMLKEFGGLGAFIAVTFLAYEVSTQTGTFQTDEYTLSHRLIACLIIGVVGGAIFGFIVGSKGKWLFFFLCLIMIPLATAEIATDGWIIALMKPAIGKYAGWALVLSAGIMMVLRFFAGIPLKYMSPPGLLLLSSCFSIVGLFALSSATGSMIFVAFVLYAVGQTFYWPTVLGLVSEQFPKGGAMTLNTVSAMGLLTVGIFGFPFLGAVQDSYNAKIVKIESPELAKKYEKEVDFFAVKYNAVKKDALFTDAAYTTNFDAVVAAKGKVKKLEKVKLDLEIAEKAHAKTLKEAEKALKEKPADKKLQEALVKAKKPFERKVAVDSVDASTISVAVLKASIEAKQANKKAISGKINETGRSTLKVAAILPMVMAVAFILMLIYYKSIGGYKPVLLGAANEDEDDSDASAKTAEA